MKSIRAHMQDWIQVKDPLDTLFWITILLKALNSLGEVIVGVSLFFLKISTLQAWVSALAQPELVEDSQDLLANYLNHISQSFSLGGKNFLMIYLLMHGILKLVLIFAILRKKLWAYPAMIGLLGAFSLYSLYKFSHVGGLYLLVFAVFDALVCILTYSEYQRLRKVW